MASTEEIVPDTGPSEMRTLRKKLSDEQRGALDKLKVSFRSYRQSQKAMAKIAASIIDLRLTFEKDGKPDYRGDNARYRKVIAAFYEAVVPDPSEREIFKVSIRYWLGKEMQARVDAKQIDPAVLMDAGFASHAPEPRKRAQRPEAQDEDLDAKNGSQALASSLSNGDGSGSMSPKEMVEAVEHVVTQHISDIGPVTAISAAAARLTTVAEAMRDEKALKKVPQAQLKRSVGDLLNAAFEVASLAKLDIEAMLTTWRSVEGTVEKGQRLQSRGGNDASDTKSRKTAGAVKS